MKHLNTVILAVIAVAVVVLYVLHFSGSEKCDNVDAQSQAQGAAAVVPDSLHAGLSSDSVQPIVYVNVAELQESLQKFDFYKEWNQKLLQKEAKSTKELKSAQQKLAAELEVFQQKYQAGGFLTKESFEQEQNRLYKKDQELQALQLRLEQEFANEQIKLSKQLMDTIDVFFKTYNVGRNYRLILNRAEVLYADEALDITSDVLEQLNQRYATTKK